MCAAAPSVSYAIVVALEKIIVAVDRVDESSICPSLDDWLHDAVAHDEVDFTLRVEPRDAVSRYAHQCRLATLPRREAENVSVQAMIHGQSPANTK